MKRGRDWTLKEVKFLKGNLHLQDKDIAAVIGRTRAAVQRYRFINGILKPKESGQFKKGQTPLNKGRKIQEWMPEESRERIKGTQFKKGIASGKCYPFGTVYPMKKTGCGDRLYIKLPGNSQYPYQIYVWEQKTGEKVKKSEVIVYKDGNPLNCDFANLEKITRTALNRKTHNPKAISEGLKKTWAVVRTFEEFGIKHPYKFKTKRGRAA